MMAIFEVFYQPGKLFASLPDRRRAWVAPLILGVLLSLCTTAAVVRMIGIETIARQQIESRGSSMSPEQMQQALNNANSPAILYVTYAAAVFGALLAPLLIAALLRFFATMASRQPRFGAMFSMVTLAFLPYSTVVCLMTLLVLFTSPDRTVLDYQNLLATNIGAFVNKETTSKGLYALLSSIDILTFGEIGLMSLGFAKVTRGSFFYGLVSVGTLWFVYVVGKVGLSLLF